MNLTLNRLIEQWSEDQDAAPEVATAFVCPGVEGWDAFWEAAQPLIRVDTPQIFWPNDLILDGVLYKDIEYPTCHLFAASKPAR